MSIEQAISEIERVHPGATEAFRQRKNVHSEFHYWIYTWDREDCFGSQVNLDDCRYYL
jgi:hypothetical protein